MARTQEADADAEAAEQELREQTAGYKEALKDSVALHQQQLQNVQAQLSAAKQLADSRAQTIAALTARCACQLALSSGDASLSQLAC